MTLDLSYSADPVQIITKPSFQKDVKPIPQIIPESKTTPSQRKYEIVWRNVLIFVYLHVAALYGLYYLLVVAQWKSFFWTYFGIWAGSLGVTMGAHRLWAHKTYKARLPLRILLAFWQTVGLQNHIYEWSRDHRVHHKFTDTDADPHNSSRGFFFSHMGWLMVKKHKDVFTKGKTVDMSDLEADPVVMFQKKYYLILAPICTFIFPAIIPWYFWGESWTVSFHTCAMLRYVLQLHGTWCINSVAHTWGARPFDKDIHAADNTTMGYIGFGEGWHNYHHVFPWDYKAGEFPGMFSNTSATMIAFFAKIGWAYDLKTVSAEMIKRRAERTGDGSRTYEEIVLKEVNDHLHENQVWGWDDKDITQDQVELAEIHHQKHSKSY